MSVTLSRVVRRDLRSGEPLPDVYQVLRRNKVRLRRGNLHLLAGKPGSLKTMFVLDMVARMGVRTLYFSNDSDESTVAQRVLARAVNRSTEAVAEDITSAKDWASHHMNGMKHVRWVFDPSPSLDDIDLEMEAFCEIYGDYPELVVIDIMDNVSYFEDSDHGTAARVLQYFHSSARTSGAAFLVVHHCTEASSNYPCPSRKDILQKQNKLPVLELTVALHGDSFFIAPVKNRHGPTDESGKTAYRLKVNPDTCTFME